MARGEKCCCGIERRGCAFLLCAPDWQYLAIWAIRVILEVDGTLRPQSTCLPVIFHLYKCSCVVSLSLSLTDMDHSVEAPLSLHLKRPPEIQGV